MANLAPEVSFYYKNICEKLTVAEKTQLKTEEQVKDKMQQLKDLKELTDELKDDSNVIPFSPLDKSKLH